MQEFSKEWAKFPSGKQFSLCSQKPAQQYDFYLCSRYWEISQCMEEDESKGTGVRA